MAPDNKIEELLEKVAALTNSVDQCHEEIAQLKNEIAGLKKRRPVTPASSKTDSFTLENFVGLKLIHFVGIIVLIIGLTIGVKYAIDVNLVSPLLRIISAYVAGAALFLLSLKLKEKYERFSSILFSGAMASAYFTTYAAFAYYSMMPAPVAFAIMFLLTIFTAYQALQYNRAEIAMLGLIGAYGIPFFVRGNSDNITGLFFYIFLINLGMLFLSFKKYWLSLNYLGFFTTWIIYFSCLYLDPEGRYYNAELFFAIAFYILFTLSTLGFKLYRRYAIQYSDSIIILLNAASLYFALSILFSGDTFEFNAATALIFAALYFTAAVLLKKSAATQQLLINALFSVSIAALIIYFPLEYDGFTITIIWVAMAIAMFVAGMYYKARLFRLAAIALFGFTLLKLLFFDSSQFSSLQKVVAYIFTGTVLLVVSFLYQRFKDRIFER